MNDKEPTIGQRLETARSLRGYNQGDIAKIINKSTTAYGHYERGDRDIGWDALKKISSFLSVNLEWLVTGEGQMEKYTKHDSAQGNDRLVYIKELDARAGGGMLAHNEDYTVVETWGIPVSALDQYMHDPDAVRIIRVTGDSMTPNYRPGQRIFVDITDNTPSPPGVFIVWDGMGTVIKRCEHIMRSDPPRLLLTSDNENYQSYELTADEAGIIGRVIGKLELC